MSTTYSHSHPFNGPLSGTTRVSRYQKGKPIWILLKQEIVSGSGISWAICKSAPRSRQITMPASHHSVFYRPDALPATQPTASKHWRHKHWRRPTYIHQHIRQQPQWLQLRKLVGGTEQITNPGNAFSSKLIACISNTANNVTLTCRHTMFPKKNASDTPEVLAVTLSNDDWNR